ncbi:HECT-like ubiquitin-conjugating enzyme-binding-domain-containing protein [Pilobolus umbonatus]|nr:HECT-like ubiquitin-conjugating enzyme-binding-domain-containing protein [Pilobolus umbonatus]
MATFYAEELGNINTLRATISADSSCNVAEEVKIENDCLFYLGSTLLVDVSLVGLSLSTDNMYISKVDCPVTDNTAYWEIKLNSTKTRPALNSQQTELKEIWSTQSIGGFEDIQCRYCATTLIQPTNRDHIYKIKSLPSEHWYELVECWICHETKPEEHKARMRPILARENLLLVGTTYFLLHPNNIRAGAVVEDEVVSKRINWNSGTSTKWISVNCTQCHHYMGEGQYYIQDKQQELLAVKLYKYNASILPEIDEKPSLNDLFISDMVSASKIHATHRYIIQGRQSNKIHGLIWLFNWDTHILYNVPSTHELKYERVMKILYLDCHSNSNHDHMNKYIDLWSNDKSTDHLIYPDNACYELLDHLNQSNNILPKFMRLMNHPAMIFTKGFSVGFIQRND